LENKNTLKRNKFKEKMNTDINLEHHQKFILMLNQIMNNDGVKRKLLSKPVIFRNIMKIKLNQKIDESELTKIKKKLSKYVTQLGIFPLDDIDLFTSLSDVEFSNHIKLYFSQ
jgi:hypothetical protein